MKQILKSFPVQPEDDSRRRMAHSAAWLYWLAIAAVLLASLLPAQIAEVDRVPFYILVAIGFLGTVVLVAFPWQRLPYQVFYLMAVLACAHVASMVYFSGGVESPLELLYFLIVIWAAYFFPFAGFAFVSLVAIVSFFVPFFYDSEYDIFHLATGFIHVLFMVIAGGLVNLLISQVKQRNLQLGRSNEKLAQKMREVLEEKEKTQALLSSVADGVYVVDTAGRIALWNKAAERITGYSKEEMIGRECFEAFPEEEEAAGDKCTPFCGTAKAEVPDGVSSSSYEVLTCRKDSEKIWLAVSAAPVRDSEGGVAGVVHVFRDISEYKEIDRMKSDFVATVSHELRTPLTSILGFSKTLLRKDVAFTDESRESFLQEIVKEGERLARLIEDVLSVSRIEAGNLRLDIKPTDPMPTVNQIIRNVSRLTSIHNFIIEIPDDLPHIQADADKFYQVLLNLVVNAVKYSPEGGKVVVSAQVDENNIRFMVSDEGVGISPEHLPHIFERFYRAGKGKAATGTGLGLYVSKNLVEQMGGRIWAESSLGQGSRFFFELPVAYSEQKVEQLAS